MKQDIIESNGLDNDGAEYNLGHNNGILPCPFCGGKEGEDVFLGRIAPAHYRIVCCHCAVRMTHDRKDKVIGIWNHRGYVALRN